MCFCCTSSRTVRSLSARPRPETHEAPGQPTKVAYSIEEQNCPNLNPEYAEEEQREEREGVSSKSRRPPQRAVINGDTSTREWRKSPKRGTETYRQRHHQ